MSRIKDLQESIEAINEIAKKFYRGPSLISKAIELKKNFAQERKFYKNLKRKFFDKKLGELLSSEREISS